MSNNAKARAAAPRQPVELPTDALSLVLYKLPLAHDIALAGLTNHSWHDAALLAFKARPFTGEVIVLDAHTNCDVNTVAAYGNYVLTGSDDCCIRVWSEGRVVRSIQAAHEEWIWSVAFLPGGERFVSVSEDGSATVWTLDGSSLCTDFEVGSAALAVACLPDGEHFVVTCRDEDAADVDGACLLYTSPSPRDS